MEGKERQGKALQDAARKSNARKGTATKPAHQPINPINFEISKMYKFLMFFNSFYFIERQEKGNARQGKAKTGKPLQNTAKQSRASQGKAMLGSEKQCKARQ